MPLFIETPLNSRAAEPGASVTVSRRRRLGEDRIREASARARTRVPCGFAITVISLRQSRRRRASTVSWSSGRGAPDALAEPRGPALCAPPSCGSGARAAAGGSRRAAWSRLAVRTARPSWSLGSLASRHNSAPRRVAKNSWFMVAGAMSAEGRGPRPNTSLKRRRSTAGRLARAAAFGHHRPHGQAAQPQPAA
jgi:hypothetical protein